MRKFFPSKKIGILLFCCYSAAAFLFLGSSRRICFVCSPYVRFIHALWWIRSFFEHILSYPLVGFRFDLLNCVARMDWSKHRGKHGVLCKQRHRTHTVAHRSSSISETSAISFAINVLLNATFLCEMVWKTEFKFCNICCNYFCSYFTHTHTHTFVHTAAERNPLRLSRIFLAHLLHSTLIYQMSVFYFLKHCKKK